MKKLDYIIIATLIAISLLSSGAVILTSSINKYEAKTVVISVNGKLYKEVPLTYNTDETFKIQTNLGENTVRISGGNVWISDATCPDKICIKDGKIHQPGQSLVCLPDKLIIEVKGISKSETDDVSF